MGIDGNIYTINQGGGNLTNITSDAKLPNGDDSGQEIKAYLFPTWSPDSQNLAFVEISGSFQSPEKARVIVANSAGEGLTEIFGEDDRLPIYLSWSPANDRIGILSTIQTGGLVLESVSVDGEESQVLDVGQPFYWDWSPDGAQVLVHIGGQTQGARVSILSLGEEVIEEMQDLHPASFQAPAWSPMGGQFLISTESGDGENHLYLTDPKGEIEENLADFDEGSVAFAWSFDGEKIAYITGDRLQTQGVLGQLAVIDLNEPDKPIMAGDEEAIAFFWSPDSKKVAYFVPSLATRSSDGQSSGTEDANTTERIVVLALFVLDVESGEARQIRVFRPATEFFNILGFFDQYHRSVTIWSPDSQNIVVTSQSDVEEDGVWVLNASGALDPRPIARGSLAFWSWE